MVKKNGCDDDEGGSGSSTAQEAEDAVSIVSAHDNLTSNEVSTGEGETNPDSSSVSSTSNDAVDVDASTDAKTVAAKETDSGLVAGSKVTCFPLKSGLKGHDSAVSSNANEEVKPSIGIPENAGRIPALSANVPVGDGGRSPTRRAAAAVVDKEGGSMVKERGPAREGRDLAIKRRVAAEGGTGAAYVKRSNSARDLDARIRNKQATASAAPGFYKSNNSEDGIDRLNRRIKKQQAEAGGSPGANKGRSSSDGMDRLERRITKKQAAAAGAVVGATTGAVASTDKQAAAKIVCNERGGSTRSGLSVEALDARIRDKAAVTTSSHSVDQSDQDTKLVALKKGKDKDATLAPKEKTNASEVEKGGRIQAAWRGGHHQDGQYRGSNNAKTSGTIGVSGDSKKSRNGQIGPNDSVSSAHRAGDIACADSVALSVETIPNEDRLPDRDAEVVRKGTSDFKPADTRFDGRIQLHEFTTIDEIVPSDSESPGKEVSDTAPGAYLSAPGLQDVPVTSLAFPTSSPTNEEGNLQDQAGGMPAPVGEAALGVGFVLPTAAIVVDDIVEADIVHEDQMEPNAKKAASLKEDVCWYQNKKCLLAGLVVVVVAPVLITLGATGTFSGSSKEAQAPDAIANPHNETELFDEIGALERLCAMYNKTIQNSGSRSFCKDAKCWVQLGSDLNGDKPSGHFGKFVRFANRSRFVVTAGDNDILSETEGLGVVRVYDYLNGVFIQVGQDIRSWAPGNELRGTLSRNGKRLAVGSPYFPGEDGRSNNLGQVRIFELLSGNWTIIGGPLNGAVKRDRYGYSVALNYNGRIVAIGATFADDKKGVVEVFQLTHNTTNETNFSWVQLGSDITSDSNHEEKTGWDLELSDDGLTVAVGGKGDTGAAGSAGRVRVLQYRNDTWTQVGYDITGEFTGDDFGRSVALSSDGKIVAGGSWMNDGANGNLTGHVRAFEYNETENYWSQLGSDIDGENQFDRLKRVTLSANGTRLAAYNTNPDLPGYAKVHELVDGEWHQIGGIIIGENLNASFAGYADISPDGGRLIVGTTDSTRDPCFVGAVRIFELRDAQ